MSRILSRTHLPVGSLELRPAWRRATARRDLRVFSRCVSYCRIRSALAVRCFSATSCPRRVCRDPYSIVRLFWTLFRSAPSAARPSSQARASPAASQGPNVWTGSEIVRIAERMQAGTGHAHLVDPVRILCAAWGTQVAASLSVLGRPVLHGRHRHAVVHAVLLHHL